MDLTDARTVHTYVLAAEVSERKSPEIGRYAAGFWLVRTAPAHSLPGRRKIRWSGLHARGYNGKVRVMIQNARHDPE